jgi:nucleoside-diphosphate-sugar epimerase
MKNVISTGSNGMIGNLILERCLADPEVSRVTSIIRKPSGISDPKLTEVIHHDFMNFDSIRNKLSGHDVCFFCIGVYTGAVPNDEFSKITVDYTRAFAEALKAQNENIRFCFLSGEGADQSEKSFILFAREKGKAENILMRTFPLLHIFRPGYIYPVQKRNEPNLMYRAMRVLYNMGLRKIYPNIGVTSVELANAMYETGIHGGTQTIYENRDIQELASKGNMAASGA